MTGSPAPDSSTSTATHADHRRTLHCTDQEMIDRFQRSRIADEDTAAVTQALIDPRKFCIFNPGIPHLAGVWCRDYETTIFSIVDGDKELGFDILLSKEELNNTRFYLPNYDVFDVPRSD
ncbi:MAG: hypothetical protein Q9205_002611 [Flavoplaca limonia]